MSSQTALSPYGKKFVAKKAFFSFMGSAFRIFGPEGNLRFYVKQKAFKLKEEITVFADESRQRPMLTIKARSMMDFSAIYDITDVSNGEKVGAMQRQGMRSLLRDEWTILDTADQALGRVHEDSGLMAFVRRFLSNLIPQTFKVEVLGQPVGLIKQRFNPFILTYDVDLSADTGGTLDPRLSVAMTVLLLAIEGRQE